MDVYDTADEFLSVHECANSVCRAEEIAAQPTVQHGRMVKRTWRDGLTRQLPARHDVTDFLTKAKDKLPS